MRLAIKVVIGKDSKKVPQNAKIVQTQKKHENS